MKKPSILILQNPTNPLPEIHLQIGELTLVADVRPDSLRRFQEAGGELAATGETIGSHQVFTPKTNP
jgi:hypothetical protein